MVEKAARRAVGRGAHPSALPNHARQAGCPYLSQKGNNTASGGFFEKMFVLFAYRPRRKNKRRPIIWAVCTAD